MADIIPFARKKPHFTVNCGEFVSVISVDDVRSIADGSLSIAEFESPDFVARTMAMICLEYLNIKN
jgi:hypothetical protein